MAFFKEMRGSESILTPLKPGLYEPQLPVERSVTLVSTIKLLNYNFLNFLVLSQPS